MTFLPTLRRVLTTRLGVRPDDLLLVALSGGADSTALLWGLTRLAPKTGFRVLAAHLDHGLDPDSERRALAAAELSRAQGVPFRLGRAEVGTERRAGESLESAARRIRYRFLETERLAVGARFVLTAHQRDDQVETVLLRLLCGSGPEGLAGIGFRFGRVARPLLGLARAELEAVVSRAGLRPVEDPGNRDLQVPRNRIRHLLLPRLRSSDPAIEERLLSLAEASTRARAKLDSALRSTLRPTVSEDRVSVSRRRLAALPEPLWSAALASLHRLAGTPYPPGRAARSDLRRQCVAEGRVGCDCGDGWRWEGRGLLLELHRPGPGESRFAYTLPVPGEVRIPELELVFGLRRGPVAPWMFEGSPSRAGLALPLHDGDRVMIRNRRPGDRIRPLGCKYRRKLKDVLIDARIPRQVRDRLPLLVVGERLAWVPGITVNEAFRLPPGGQAWIATLEVSIP